MTNLKTEGSIQQNAEKILNVGHAEVVNNNYYAPDVKSVKRIYNKNFTQELIKHLKSEKDFPRKLAFVDTEDWMDTISYVKEAQRYISQSFIWVIGEELRRMFVIGDQKYANEENKIADYIDRSLRTYRSGLQLMNYVFISKLLDEKFKNEQIDTDKPQISKFYTAEKDLELIDLRMLFKELLEIFGNNPEMEFPMDKEEFVDIGQFIQPDTEFNQACVALEKLLKLQGSEESYKHEHCEIAEKSLAMILSKLICLTKYQLVSVKHIEYEESRNNAPQYIKEMRIIKLPAISSENETNSDAMENLIHTLMYDGTPQKTNSVLFYKKNGYIKNSINLFPFLIDKNALDDQREFDLYYYEHLNIDELKLRYYSTRTGPQSIPCIKARILSPEELKEDNALDKFIIDTRIELVSKQFQLARNTMLNDDFDFTGVKNVLLQ